METDKRYFIEGLFIIVISVAAALFAVWLTISGHRDDVLYRIHFTESVSGLTVGDPVKFHGVEVGNVKTLAIDEADPRRVTVDVALRKDTPVKTDTKATLKLKGITGVIFIELTGGAADAKTLVASTPAGQIPEIPVEKSTMATLLDELPKVVAKFSSLEDRATKVVADIGSTTSKIKENPSLLLRSPKPPEKAPSERPSLTGK
jgi:phospholipid/cholesterol/gamma-HCH transport system substrate-binding protein